MPTANDAATNTAGPAAPAKRKPSKETLLKREMASIKRELDSVQKDLDAFEAMKAKHDTIVAKKTQLNEKLNKVKQDLIVALGLDG